MPVAPTANERLAYAVAAINECPKFTELAAIAQRLAGERYRAGERYHAGNNTVYPARHYRYLDSLLGVLSASQYVAFDELYTAHMDWYGNV